MPTASFADWGGQTIGVTIFVGVLLWIAWTMWSDYRDHHRGDDDS